MPTFLNVEDFDLILSEAGAERRAGLGCRLYGDYEAGALSPGEDRAAVSIFRALARDPDKRVRIRFARFVARSAALPGDIAGRLASDLPQVATPVVTCSPVFSDEMLVDLIATGDSARQVAAARRAQVSAPVSAALIEVASARACIDLLRNPGAKLPSFAFDRLIERFGDDFAIREAMLRHPGVPISVVERHLSAVADRLERFVTATGWLDAQAAFSNTASALELSLIAYAQDRTAEEVDRLVRHWFAAGRVGTTFVVRAAFFGAVAVVASALSAGSRLPVGRVKALLADRSSYGLRSLCTRMRLDEDAATAIARARLAWVDADQLPAREGRRLVGSRIANSDFAPHLALPEAYAAIAAEIASPVHGDRARIARSLPRAARDTRRAA